MVNEAKGRLFRRADGKYLIYVPKALADDSMFPFKLTEALRGGATQSIRVKVSFKLGDDKLLVEKAS